MIYVVADTNALIAPFKRGFNIDRQLEDILGAYTVVVPGAIIGELRRLARSNTHARAALRYALSMDIRKTAAAGDDAVLELAVELKGYVMTNDRAMIQAARDAGLGVIRLREKSRLAVEGGGTD